MNLKTAVQARIPDGQPLVVITLSHLCQVNYIYIEDDMYLQNDRHLRQRDCSVEVAYLTSQIHRLRFENVSADKGERLLVVSQSIIWSSGLSGEVVRLKALLSPRLVVALIR